MFSNDGTRVDAWLGADNPNDAHMGADNTIKDVGAGAGAGSGAGAGASLGAGAGASVDARVGVILVQLWLMFSHDGVNVNAV